MPLDRIGSKYLVQRTLHQGPQTSSVVYGALDQQLNRKVAVKSIERLPGVDMGLLQSELKILRTLNGHPNIVGFIEEIQTPYYVHIVMECASGDLVDEIAKYAQGMSEDSARSVLGQLLSALQLMHSHGLIHRDIKCENVLFDDCGKVRLCDFGLATSVSSIDNATRRCGTRCYAAPEILSGLASGGFAADVWSLGVVLFGIPSAVFRFSHSLAMLSGCLPFREASPICRRYSRFVQGNRSFAPWNRFSADALSLLERMLDPVPARRATLPEIVSHPFLLTFCDSEDSFSV